MSAEGWLVAGLTSYIDDFEKLPFWKREQGSKVKNYACKKLVIEIVCLETLQVEDRTQWLLQHKS